VTISRNQAIFLGIAAFLLVVVFFIGGQGFRGCGCAHELTPIVLGIDAGPGEAEINARLDGSLVVSAARIEQIEEKFEEDMAAFDAAQRAEYERLRGGDDLDAAARMLSEWNRRRRGTP
jgi:hypothetical protein